MRDEAAERVFLSSIILRAFPLEFGRGRGSESQRLEDCVADLIDLANATASGGTFSL